MTYPFVLLELAVLVVCGRQHDSRRYDGEGSFCKEVLNEYCQYVPKGRIEGGTYLDDLVDLVVVLLV